MRVYVSTRAKRIQTHAHTFCACELARTTIAAWASVATLLIRAQLYTYNICMMIVLYYMHILLYFSLLGHIVIEIAARVLFHRRSHIHLLCNTRHHICCLLLALVFACVFCHIAIVNTNLFIFSYMIFIFWL